MPADHQTRPTVSTTQLMSSALAAVTAAVVGSRLGIAGTLAGAAAGSVIGTIGTAMYGHWLDRTATKVRTVVRIPNTPGSRTNGQTAILDAVDDQAPEPSNTSVPTEPTETTGPMPTASRQPTWRTVGLATVATFAVAIGSITAFEAIAGQPVSTLTGGDAGSGTTLGRAVDPGPDTTVIQPDPPPSTTPPTTEPTPTETPTTTPTTTPPTVTPTVTPTESSTTPPPTSTPPTTPTSPPT